MRNFFLGIICMALIALGIKIGTDVYQKNKTNIQSSGMIMSQIKNVGKLIVTEGHFSDVITYKDAKKLYIESFTAEKKALVVVNATVMISYNLQQIEHTLDVDQKKVIISDIPEAEINIIPEIKYHDLQEDFFNQFTPEDHNKIRAEVLERLHSKVKTSSLVTNSKNRLFSELQKIYILTNSLGWTLQYQENVISSVAEMEDAIPDFDVENLN